MVGVTNVITLVLSLPLAAVVVAILLALRVPNTLALAVAAVAVLPNPLAAGLQQIANEQARADGVFFSDIWDGLRRHGPIAFRAWLLSLLGTGIIVVNLGYYGRAGGAVGLIVVGIWVYVLLVWLAMHLYIYPLLMEQEVKRVILVFRNAFVMTASHPVFTGVVVFVWLLMLLATSLTGLIAVVGLAMAASLQQNATVVLLGRMSREPTGAEM